MISKIVSVYFKILVNDLRYIVKELKECFKQFWNFGKTNAIIFELPEINELVRVLGVLVKLVRDDKADRLKQISDPKVRKKMDEEDLEYLNEDIKKIAKLLDRIT